MTRTKPERPTPRDVSQRPAADAFPLEPIDARTWRSRTDPRFWNQIGPFGGWLAGLTMAAMRELAPPASAPRSLAVHYLAAAPAGDLVLEGRVVREQRRVSGLRVELRGAQEATASVVAEGVFGVSRPEASAATLPPPHLPAAARLPRYTALDPLAPFVKAFDYRIAAGEPFAGGGSSQSSGWLRPDLPYRPGPEWLLMLADAWFPPAWAGRDGAVPVSTISLQVVFHDCRDLCQDAEGFFRASFREESRADGFGLERGELWWPDGRLALTSQQLTWIGEGGRAPRAAQASLEVTGRDATAAMA